MKMAELENSTLDDIEIDTEVEEAANDEIDTIEAEDEDDGEDDVVVSIGEESPPQEEEVRAPAWVRELRKSNREKERKIRELEAQINTAATENKPVALGKKPSLEDCDYDSEEYENKLSAWYDDKRIHDASEAEAGPARC
jgi:hypothetical protein